MTERNPGRIEHREHERLSICREDYLAICDGHQAAAHLLNDFEFWHTVRLTGVEQDRACAAYQPGYRPNLSVVVYKNYKDLKKDLLGEYSEDKLRFGIRLLMKKGFITQERTRNPWNRTGAFRFQPEAVQAALREYWKGKSLEVHAREIGDRPREVVGASPKAERCSYKNTACESTANESTAVSGQDNNFSFQNQNRPGQANVAQKVKETWYDDGPQFNQIEYWNL